MPQPVQSQSATHSLVTALRTTAAQLPTDATATATALSRYAAQIEEPSTADEALKNFNAFAMHYKGLRDLLVPGCSETEWLSFVNEVRSLSKAAMYERGLNRTLLARVRALFSGHGSA
jgi:hypothetical protein